WKTSRSHHLRFGQRTQLQESWLPATVLADPSRRSEGIDLNPQRPPAPIWKRNHLPNMPVLWRQITILNDAPEKPHMEQFCTDLVEIMTVFCSKIYGHRSHRNRKR